MKSLRILGIVLLAISLTNCSTWNRTQKGAAVGTGAGAATGAVVGRAAGNTGLGAIIGATVGGVAGAIIGKQMDKQAEEMKQNIPEADVKRVDEGILLELNGEILFGFDESNLTSNAKQNLNQLVTILQKYPDTDVEIQGHTDDKGTNAYNNKLSERRAAAVKSYLVQNNVSSSRLAAIGFGKTNPEYPNDTDLNRAKNRRVVFLVVANEKMKQDAQNQAAK